MTSVIMDIFGNNDWILVNAESGHVPPIMFLLRFHQSWGFSFPCFLNMQLQGKIIMAKTICFKCIHVITPSVTVQAY